MFVNSLKLFFALNVLCILYCFSLDCVFLKDGENSCCSNDQASIRIVQKPLIQATIFYRIHPKCHMLLSQPAGAVEAN